MKAIKVIVLSLVLLVVGCKCKARVNEYKFFETYCQYAPAVFVLCSGAVGIESKHAFVDRTMNLALTTLISTAIVYPLKWTIKESRPDGTAYNSFPSGHTAATFAGAELVRMEYGWGWGALFYANAIMVGTMRVVHHRHWWWDVATGAAIGMGSAHLGRLATDRINLLITPSSFSLTYNF